MLQAWQLPHEALPQHTPSTQAPLAQSAFATHDCPMGRPTHVPLMQISLPLQSVPSPALPVVMHTWLPLAQV
jgi:hypothetical protein